MTEEETEQYARWILEECNEPIDEIQWLLSNVPKKVAIIIH